MQIFFNWRRKRSALIIMSKNTNLNGFRRINIDAFDPENYIDDDNQAEDETGPNEGEIVGLLNS